MCDGGICPVQNTDYTLLDMVLKKPLHTLHIIHTYIANKVHYLSIWCMYTTHHIHDTYSSYIKYKLCMYHKVIRMCCIRTYVHQHNRDKRGAAIYVCTYLGLVWAHWVWVCPRCSDRGDGHTQRCGRWTPGTRTVPPASAVGGAAHIHSGRHYRKQNYCYF